MTDKLRKSAQDYIDARYPSWNLDAALRYLPVAQHLNRSGAEQVLDVGSGGVGLSLYWGRPTIALDVSLPEAVQGSLIRPALGTATALPFRDRSIEVVVSCDVLEHIPRADRAEALSEMVRVARSQIVLAAPCGRLAQDAEEEVAQIYREKTGEDHLWLREHLLHGLPDAAELEAEIRSLAEEGGRQAHIRVQKNTNLRIWRFLFRQYFGGGPRKGRLIRYYMLSLMPLLRRIHWGETYRKIFFVQFGDRHRSL
jgi:hypothetical protein